MYSFIFIFLTALIVPSALAEAVHYPAGEKPVKHPNHRLLNQPLPPSAYNQEDKKAEAMSLYLTLMREDAYNVWAPFQLAASSAEKGQTELAERYLQLSAKRGLWYYYNLLEYSAFQNLQDSDTYRSVLAETKARHQQHAAKFEAKPLFAVPSGEPPPGGWPTIVYLHSYGRTATLTQEDRLIFAQMGVAYIALNGTQMLAEESFRWSNYSDETTQAAIQRVVQQLTPVLKLNPQQIFLAARGQGALHGANLMAKYPQFYAGALLVAPQGKIQPAQFSLAENKRIMIATYTRQQFSEQAMALNFHHLFDQKNQVKTAQFAEGEKEVGGWHARFRPALRWMMGKNQEPSPKT